MGELIRQCSGDVTKFNYPHLFFGTHMAKEEPDLYKLSSDLHTHIHRGVHLNDCMHVPCTQVGTQPSIRTDVKK